VLTFGDDNFLSLEAAGVKEACNAAFVLVAGGLGERLGYKGIKVMRLDFLIENLPLS
jgi:UDP-sugar pyrophosphorylase